MADFGQIGQLVSNLGASIGINLALSKRGEAAVECGNGIIVVFTAATAAQALILEGRRQRHVLPSTADALHRVLTLNRRPEMVAVAVAIDADARALCTRQFVSVSGMTPQIFTNIVNAFVTSTAFAFREIDALVQSERRDDGNTTQRMEIDEMVVFRA